MSIIEVKVPDIGDFKDVPVIGIEVSPGDTVKAEDPLVTLESDKATMEVPSPAAGVVKEIKLKIGDKVAEGTLVLLLSSLTMAWAVRCAQLLALHNKARFMRGDAEHLITVAKNGLADRGNRVHAQRLAAQVIDDPEVTKRLFTDIAPRFTERPGGYTRMVKVGPRTGDGAEMVMLELVEKGSAKDENETGKSARRLRNPFNRGKGAEK